MTMTLDKIKLDDLVIVKQVMGEEGMKRRLFDLGFIPGSLIKCVLISPFKDPKAYKINNNTIAIRNIDACNIEVDYERD